MLVDDSTLVLLASSFGILVCAVCQLIGWWGKWWSSLMVGVFFAAILLQCWNTYLGWVGGVVTVSDKAFSLIFLCITTALIKGLVDNLTSWVWTGAGLCVVIVALVYGFPMSQSWTRDSLGLDVSMWEYLVVLVVLGFLFTVLALRVTDWPWWGRVFNALMITFICTEALIVIVERDPTTGFATTEIDVLTFDNGFLWWWLLVSVIYFINYYIAYKHMPWHNDRHEDERKRVYEKHLKDKASPSPHAVVVPATPHPQDTHHHPHHHETHSRHGQHHPHPPDTVSLLYPQV